MRETIADDRWPVTRNGGEPRRARGRPRPAEAQGGQVPAMEASPEGLADLDINPLGAHSAEPRNGGEPRRARGRSPAVQVFGPPRYPQWRRAPKGSRTSIAKAMQRRGLSPQWRRAPKGSRTCHCQSQCPNGVQGPAMEASPEGLADQQEREGEHGCLHARNGGEPRRARGRDQAITPWSLVWCPQWRRAPKGSRTAALVAHLQMLDGPQWRRAPKGSRTGRRCRPALRPRPTRNGGEPRRARGPEGRTVRDRIRDQPAMEASPEGLADA